MWPSPPGGYQPVSFGGKSKKREKRNKEILDKKDERGKIKRKLKVRPAKKMPKRQNKVKRSMVLEE
jgi:hypothetical protein